MTLAQADVLTVSQKQLRETTSLTWGDAVKTVQDWECWRDLVRALFVEWHEEVFTHFVDKDFICYFGKISLWKNAWHFWTLWRDIW